MKADKGLLVTFLGAAMALVLLGGVALAGTETATRVRGTLVRGDPYYWVKCEQERLGLCVYAGTDAEAGFRLQIAQERLDEAVQLMEQNRFTEANSALEQYRAQIQAMNQAMVSIKERAATEAAIGSGTGNKMAARTGWLSPGEIVARVERQTCLQLQTLERLCAQSRDQVREQARLALEECMRARAQDQSGQISGQSNQGSAAGQPNQVQGTSVNSGQQTRIQERIRTQKQNQTQQQNQQQQQQNQPTQSVSPQQDQGPGGPSQDEGKQEQRSLRQRESNTPSGNRGSTTPGRLSGR